MEAKRITNYNDFWKFYVSEHSNPLNRLLHLTGTILSCVLLFSFILVGKFQFTPLCFVVGYGFAWVGHFVIEKNRPATFQYPLWSFISDYKMVFLMITGRMGSEVDHVSNILGSKS